MVIVKVVKNISQSDLLGHVLEVHLSQHDYKILDKYRGTLSYDAFISMLLRVIDSGAVSSTPMWLSAGAPNANGVSTF